MGKKIFILSSLLTIVIGCVARSPQTSIQTVTIRDHVVNVTLAQTPEEQRRGLAGVTELDMSDGMLFPFSPTAEQTFWMKDMLTPIDIIWIAGDTVVGVEKNVPLASPGVPDSNLPKYISPVPVDYVLEVAAGFADTYEVMIGDRVTYSQ